MSNAYDWMQPPTEAGYIPTEGPEQPRRPELTAAPVTVRNRIAEYLMGEGRPSAARANFVRGLMGSTGAGPGGVGLVDFVPFVGAALQGSEEAQQGNYTMAGVTMVPGAAPARRALRGAGGAAKTTGSLNPLANEPVTFRGVEPKDFTPAQAQAFGEHYGAPNIGPLSPPRTYKDLQGKELNIPGGVEGEGWTYTDLLNMKANPINPRAIDPALHVAMQQKLGRTMTPAPLTDADVWNGLAFGITSPNNPLFPNQMASSRLRLRTPEMLQDLSSMVPWELGANVPRAQRLAVDDEIARRYGLSAAPEGIGARGTQQTSRIAEMARMFQQDPAFFRKAPSESWEQAVERVASQTPGLSMKTGSLGMVWQDPALASISAIDRHMARELEQRGGIFASPAERAGWETQSVGRWNKREADLAAKEGTKPDPAADFRDLVSKRGSDGFLGEMLLDHVGKAKEPKFRMATGEINPNLPKHLAQAKWVHEPEKVQIMGRTYKEALALNQKLADEAGLNLFAGQQDRKSVV